MKTSFFTSVSPHNGIYDKRLKSIIMKGEKEHIEKQEIIQELREAIMDGIDSGIAESFNPELHLEMLKREYNNV